MLTRRERDRLLDLLLKWSTMKKSLLDGTDRDAIGVLRYLLYEEADAAEAQPSGVRSADPHL